MKTYTITPKGQVTLPVEIREKLKVKPGDKITYQSTDHGIVLKSVQRDMLDDFGFLKAKQAPVEGLETIRKSVRKKISERRLSK